MERYNEDNGDRYSPLFNISLNENWLEQPDDQSVDTALLMDVDTSTISQSLTNTVEYSDMVWSPIPTQSTLNNWHMLTQSLSQDGFGRHSSQQDYVDGQLDVCGADMERGFGVCAAARTPLMQSPDMFVESPVVGTPTSFFAVVDDSDVLMTRENECIEQPDVVVDRSLENNCGNDSHFSTDDWHMNSSHAINCQQSHSMVQKIVFIPESHNNTIIETLTQQPTCDYIVAPANEASQHFKFTKPISINSVREPTTIPQKSSLNTISETRDKTFIQSSVPCTIPETPDLKPSPSVQYTIPETPDIQAISVADAADNDATFCSNIERELQHISTIRDDDDSTFCSQLVPISNGPQRDASVALNCLDLDITFCSLIELELEQTRKRDTETFDFEDAILRILNVDELQNLQSAGWSQPRTMMSKATSGEFGLVTNVETRSQQPTSDHSSISHQQRIEKIVLRFLIDLADSHKKTVYLNVQRLGWSGCSFDVENQASVKYAILSKLLFAFVSVSVVFSLQIEPQPGLRSPTSANASQNNPTVAFNGNCV